MIEGLRDVWSKLTPEEQQELGQALEKAFQEEIDRKKHCCNQKRSTKRHFGLDK